MGGMSKNLDWNKVQNEVEIFKTEYLYYSDDYVLAYARFLDHFTKAEKNAFIKQLT